MTYLSPLTEDEKHRRKRVVEDGEFVDFDMAFMDAAPTRYFTDHRPADALASQRAMRDAAQAAQILGLVALPSSVADMAAPAHFADNASVRDYVRAAQYAG